MIKIHTYTQDQRTIAMCKRYWAVDMHGMFIETIQAIAADFKINVRRLNSEVQQNSTATYFYTKDDWEICTRVDSRSEFARIRKEYKRSDPRGEFTIKLSLADILGPEEPEEIASGNQAEPMEHQYMPSART